MSKPRPKFPGVFLQCVILLIFVAPLAGQEVEVTIEVGSAGFRVDGRFVAKPRQNPRNLSFIQSVAGIDGLGKRISGLTLFDASGRPVEYKKFIDGEFVADADFARWSYQLDLVPSKNRNAAAHASWLGTDNGVLMLGDLLPLVPAKTAGKVILKMPDGWSAHAGVRESSAGVLNLDDVETSVIYIGKDWRAQKIFRYKESPWVAVSGQWHFTDAELNEMVAEIYTEYKELFRWEPPTETYIAITKFPTPMPPGSWAAETRGRSVTIVSSDMAFRTQSLQRLHEQLRHEMFHLWIPNGVKLSGNYDWFYEGFALYQSLKMGVALNRIRFEDFLDTLSRAHTIDSAYTQRPSLLTASANRFSGANTQVYARGMLVAFLSDLAILKASGGKRSVSTLVAGLGAKFRGLAQPMDGNTAVIGILLADKELEPIVEKYVQGRETIEWTKTLASAGIEDADAGPITKLSVREKLGGAQKTLLDKLGYNSWRKLSRNSK